MHSNIYYVYQLLCFHRLVYKRCFLFIKHTIQRTEQGRHEPAGVKQSSWLGIEDRGGQGLAGSPNGQGQQQENSQWLKG